MSAALASTARLPIRERVRAARRRWILARAAECLMLAAAAAAIELSAGALGGAEPLAPPLAAAATLAGLLCGATWWFEHRRSEREVALRVDRKLGLDGALATAFEVEDGAAPGSLAALLVERAERAVPRARAVGAVAPPSPLFAAAPLIACAVLALSLERSPASRATPPKAEPPAGRAIGALEPSAGETTPGAVSIESTSTLSAPQGLREAHEPPAISILREHGVLSLSAPRRAGESPVVDPRTSDRRPGERAAETSEALDAGADPAASGEGEAGSAAAAANDAGAGSGAAAAAPPSSDPPAAGAEHEPGGAERGTLAGRWWAPRHDAVVAGWVEARRASAARER